MPFYLLTEGGDRILLEDLTGAILLEEVVAPPTIFYQAGGSGGPAGRRKKRRRELDALFARLERTIEAGLGLAPILVALTPASADTAREDRPGRDSAAALEAAISELATLAAGHQAFDARIERLRESLRRYAAEQAALDDDEDTWLLMS